MKRVLVAGMGNVLRRDDALGVEVARRLADQRALPEAVKVTEVGIGGIHLVHELMAGYDVLIIVDAVEQGSAPGTIHIFEANVPHLPDWPEAERQAFLADTHYATPSKALILAKALGVLPPQAYIIGCQPANADELGIGFSEALAGAVDKTAEAVTRLIATL